MSEQLLEAVERGDMAEVRRLIDAGADVNFRDWDEGGLCPLDFAADNGNVEMLRLLLDAGASDLDFVSYALRSQHPDIVREWLKLPGATEYLEYELNSEGQTLLIWAAVGSVEIVKLLVEAGANVDKRTVGMDESALGKAARRGNTPVVHYLWPFCSQETRQRAGVPNDPRPAA
jgi:ankyrin repeat protein